MPSRQPFYVKQPASNAVLTHSIDLGLTSEDLDHFFDGSRDQLCPHLEDLDIPEVTKAALERCQPFVGWHSLDRIIIYTDGSSRSHLRGMAPLRADELGFADTWAMIVLGETYGDDSQESSICFIGWMAHPVLYDAALNHFADADRIGSDIAEREALLWAALWRIRLNISVPTIFRSDSALNVHQAQGLVGAIDATPSFRHLRATFQLLGTLLPHEHLIIEHIHGHCGEPWNEGVDFLAGHEASKSFHMARIGLDFARFRNMLSFLWMIFAESLGMPRFQNGQFDVHPINLPPKGDFQLQPQESRTVYGLPRMLCAALHRQMSIPLPQVANWSISDSNSLTLESTLLVFRRPGQGQAPL